MYHYFTILSLLFLFLEIYQSVSFYFVFVSFLYVSEVFSLTQYSDSVNNRCCSPFFAPRPYEL